MTEGILGGGLAALVAGFRVFKRAEVRVAWALTIWALVVGGCLLSLRVM